MEGASDTKGGRDLGDAQVVVCTVSIHLLSYRGRKHTDSGIMAVCCEFLGEKGIRSPEEEDFGGGRVVHVRNWDSHGSSYQSSEDGEDGELHYAGCLR